eukprot:m.186505 g.186505  ORF g.186505 m.186505 type:complete len:58 (-) comp16784_c0_seq1:41-214(-)
MRGVPNATTWLLAHHSRLACASQVVAGEDCACPQCDGFLQRTVCIMPAASRMQPVPL